MKKFFAEFKKFITRGNIVDMAVGVIVGSAFTAIVTALTNQIFRPLVNWALSGTEGGLEQAVTMLKTAYDEAGAVDMSRSIYIDWGAFITAVVNFLIVAFVLFALLKAFNGLQDASQGKYFGYDKKEYFALRKQGRTRRQIAQMAADRDKEVAAQKAAEEAEAKRHTAEALLEDIKEILQRQLPQ